MTEYIDKEALKESFWASCNNCLSEDDIADLIDEMPAADVAPVVHGKWIDKGWDGDFSWRIDGRGNSWHIFECSNCGSKLCGAPKTKFCPNCGAKMDLEDENEPA